MKPSAKNSSECDNEGGYRPPSFSIWVFCWLCLLLAGCSRAGSRADIVILNGAELESLDPALVTSQPDLRVVAALFEGLVRSDPVTGRPVPGLAERWTVSDDGCAYTFFLRTNLVWSTGEPIVADDFVYSWRRVLDPKTACDYAGQLFYIKNAEAFNQGQLTDPAQLGFRALDAYALRVELKNPVFFFLDLCTLPAVAVVPRRQIEKYGDRWILSPPLPVSGPYLLDSWRLNDKIRLKKNPLYWDAANTQNEVVDVLPVASSTTAMNLYETGAADIVWDKELVPVELLDVVLKRPDFHTFDYLASYFARFNTTKPPFTDPRVRRAFAMAVDKNRIVQKITRAGEKPASNLTPPGIAHYRPPAGLAYDPSGAKRLLAEAGFPEGKGFPACQYMFNAAAGGAAKTHQKIGIELQNMWRDVLGVQVDLRQVESKIFLTAQSALDYDICRSSWLGDYADPNTFLDLFLSNSGNNRTGWKNANYDRFLEKANATLNPAAREDLLRQAETLLVSDEAPIIPLFFYVGICYFDTNRIQGIYPNLVDLHPINAIKRLK